MPLSLLLNDKLLLDLELKLNSKTGWDKATQESVLELLQDKCLGRHQRHDNINNPHDHI